MLVPGGVSLLSEEAEDLGKVQTIGARFAHGEISLEHAAEMGCRACGSPGGGCQFLGTAATSQVVAEAMGMTLPAQCALSVRHPGLEGHGASIEPGPGRHGGRADAPWRTSWMDGRSRMPWWSMRLLAGRPI